MIAWHPEQRRTGARHATTRRRRRLGHRAATRLTDPPPALQPPGSALSRNRIADAREITGPDVAGVVQSFQIDALLPQTDYWIGIRAFDDCHNAGYDLMLDHDTGALALVDQALRQPSLHASVKTILPADRALIASYLSKRGDSAPSIRFILSWETDGNDVDLHVRDRSGNHAWYSNLTLRSGGALLEDIRDGYGPEMFTVDRPDAFPYKLGVHYYARGPEGVGLGSVQIIRTDGHGDVRVEHRPFVIQNDQAYVDLGTVAR